MPVARLLTVVFCNVKLHHMRMRQLIAPTLARYACDTARRLENVKGRLSAARLGPAETISIEQEVSAYKRLLRDIEDLMPEEVLLDAFRFAKEPSDQAALHAEVERRKGSSALQADPPPLSIAPHLTRA